MIETRRLKNIVIFVQTILSFALSRKSISIDTTPFLEHHITSLSKKASQKLHALARIAHYMDFEKGRSLMKAFVISQFNYCP